MIVTFGSKETLKIWEGEWVSNLPPEVQHMARRKLRMLNNAQSTADLLIPPSNRLEKLKGDLQGHYSIRVNDQWRLIFSWDGRNAREVELLDYH
ncbi:MAG: type II toxin-antitoxin system RelE/ParE family toxin [Bacteroidetes bacterium]|nr:type II toxin-antitoxin system RelE/ParE family toxin [Bacteroidota bacterium]